MTGERKDAGEILDELLATLESAAARKLESSGGDAIDVILNAPGRTTAVRSLRESPEVAAFRDALVDGLIRVDTANQLLRLVNAVVTRLL